jgi:hypothetical protein
VPEARRRTPFAIQRNRSSTLGSTEVAEPTELYRIREYPCGF